jgi:hypothetical protein
VRTRATAALIAALAVLPWVGPAAMAADRPHQSGTAPARHLAADRPRLPGTTPALHLGGLNDTAVVIVGIVLLVAIAIFVSLRIRRRGAPGRSGSDRSGRAPNAARRVGHGRMQPATTDRGHPAGLGTDELAAEAAEALVETDDAVRTSEQELGFASARFGDRAARPFAAALESAQAELGEAFRLQQLLDDDSAASDAARRSRLTGIRAHCAEASRLLDAQAEAFDQLHEADARPTQLAGQLAAEVDAHVAQQTARISRSRQILAGLAARYTPDAVLTVVTNLDEAAQRLEFAAASLARARHELAGGRSADAAVQLQAAEAGADQATDLLNGVEHREAELTQAASALPGALREVDAEIAEAEALLAGLTQDKRATAVTRAQAVAGDVRASLAGGPFDSLAALREVQLADAALDHALASVRADQARRERTRAVLDQAMLVARSSVIAADDFITTRRGAVGAAARTRLAEAQRHFRQAIAAAQPDPEAALSEAQEADLLAEQAWSVAERDVAGFHDRRVAGPGGAILGGILIGDGPGSFGGAGTRRRHSARDTRTAGDTHRADNTHAAGNTRAAGDTHTADETHGAGASEAARDTHSAGDRP